MTEVSRPAASLVSAVPMIGGLRLGTALLLFVLAEYPASISAFVVPSTFGSRRNDNAFARGHCPTSPSSPVPGLVHVRANRVQTRLYMDMKPLASEGDWSAYLDDETTGLVYYFNGKTGESLWEPPTKTFPAVKMTRKQERAMTEKRLEYEASLAEQEDKKQGGGGFFSSLLGGSKEEAEANEPEEIVEEPIVEEIMKAPKGLGAFFASAARSKETSSANGIIEDAIEDEGAYSGSYQGREAVVKKEPAAAPEEEAPAPAPVTAPKKAFAFAEIFKAKPKEADIIIPSDNPIKIEVASKVLPSPEKASWGGEDAVFTKGRTFGVFDGVSGAEKEDGLALYSFTLASQVKSLIGNDGLTIGEMTDALATAADIANMEATGASTATLASIGEDGFLRVLTLGDCSVLVYRDGQVVAKTKEILHYFDCPYQLAEDSPDKAKDGTKLTFEVQTGDIIVAGSDGIFDNLTDDQIWDQISSVPARAGMIAGKIINQSRAVSLDPEAPTPYAKLAKKNRYEEYKTGLGGKLDDISCVVVRCL